MTPCESDEEALNHIQRNTVDLIIADLQSSAATNVALLQAIKEINPEAAFIALIESHNSDAAMAALTTRKPMPRLSCFESSTVIVIPLISLAANRALFTVALKLAET